MKKSLTGSLLLLFLAPVWADMGSINGKKSHHKAADIVENRVKLEKRDGANPFLISFHKPTYLFPFYYNRGIPYLPFDNNVLPDGQKLKNAEVKFQISFKVPVVRNIFNWQNALYIAYTQNSYWQAYGGSPFFRETNYEPELFMANNLDLPLFAGWRVKLLNIGAVHQSNGRGGNLERSWNRTYLESIFAKGKWMVSVKPWYILHDFSLSTHNPDMADYLGHSQFVVSYKYGDNIFSVMNRNSIESDFKRGAVELTWSYPLLPKIKGYVQVFSGYGQNLIEYNQYSNSIGLGFALSDWV